MRPRPCFQEYRSALPQSLLARLGQVGVSDVIDVVRYGVGDVLVLRVTTALASSSLELMQTLAISRPVYPSIIP